jgi:protein-S-isoprenylcysteine O-methyltransferase Ste14
MVVLSVFALLILGFVVASYYGIWTGIFEPLRELRKRQSREQRRKTAGGQAFIALFSVLLLTLGIAAPFGRYSLGYVAGGAGVFIFVAVHLIVIGEIRKNHRDRRS